MSKLGEFDDVTVTGMKCRHGLPSGNCADCNGKLARMLHEQPVAECNCHFCNWARLNSFERQMNPYKPL